MSAKALNVGASDARRACPEKSEGVRMLVVIASHGTRNLVCLKKIIANYQRMSFATDIIVLSNAPKDLGQEVEVMVGAPTSNPRSLPFRHREIFAERAARYDLFVYSEDDMAVTEGNLRAFLRVAPELASDEIAGYLRYETNTTGERSLPEAHGIAHWKCESIKTRACGRVAEFSNEHAAFYVLNRAQLLRAIGSGGFLVEPHEGRYDMLCSAATDAYTSCGFRKVICLEHMEDFLIHHMTNQYAGALGMAWERFREEVDALGEIEDGERRSAYLCNLETPDGQWSKSYDDACEHVMRSVRPGVSSLLSIGASSGREEEFWRRSGTVVTAVPLNAAKGALLRKQGIEVVEGPLSEMKAKLLGRRFDCVVSSNLLHLQKEPALFLQVCANLLGPGGSLILKAPNFEFLPIQLRRLRRRRIRGGGFDQRGYHEYGLQELRRWLRTSGLALSQITWINDADRGNTSGALSVRQRLRNWIGSHVLRFRPSRMTADHLIVLANRMVGCDSSI